LQHHRFHRETRSNVGLEIANTLLNRLHRTMHVGERPRRAQTGQPVGKQEICHPFTQAGSKQERIAPDRE
jgi:hypothetical protein